MRTAWLPPSPSLCALALILGLVLGLASPALADCVDAEGNDIYNEPDKFQALIAETASCGEAAALAEACAYGSSMDSSTAGAAVDVCKAEMKASKISKDNLAMLETMEGMCADHYKDMDGTMYIGFAAYCVLDANSWMAAVTAPADAEP